MDKLGQIAEKGSNNGSGSDTDTPWILDEEQKISQKINNAGTSSVRSEQLVSIRSMQSERSFTDQDGNGPMSASDVPEWYEVHEMVRESIDSAGLEVFDPTALSVATEQHQPNKQSDRDYRDQIRPMGDNGLINFCDGRSWQQLQSVDEVTESDRASSVYQNNITILDQKHKQNFQFYHNEGNVSNRYDCEESLSKSIDGQRDLENV